MNRLNPALKGMTTSFYFIAKDDKRFNAPVPDQYISYVMPAPLSLPGSQS